MKIPDEAIEAAAAALDALGSVGPNLMPNYVARAAIEAAMPAIREHIAQELLDTGSAGWLYLAARIVRGG